MSEILVRDMDQLLSIVSADHLRDVAYNEARRREGDFALTDEEIATGGFCPYAAPPITDRLRGLGVLAARTEYHEMVPRDGRLSLLDRYTLREWLRRR
jgi:hypothetical protein